jgi:branched-chain amino acid transport system permease protein
MLRGEGPGAARASASAWRRLTRPGDLAGMAALVALMLIAPAIISQNNVSVATTGLLFAVALLGLGVVSGRAGMISLVQVGFMAIGAYVFVWLQLHAPGVPFPVAVLLGGLGTLPFGLIVGLPALRLRGVLLGVVTLALATALSVYLTVKDFPGLNSGFTVVPPSWLASQNDYFRFCAVIFILLAFLASVAGRTRIGLTWMSIRHSERATAALGRSVLTAKLSAFALSAFLAGFAGAMLVGQFGIVAAQSFLPLDSLTLFALAIMVGARFPEGALIGGMLFSFMPIILGKLSLSQDYGNLLFAVGAVLGLKGGYGMAEELRERLRRRRRRGGAGVASAAAFAPAAAPDPSAALEPPPGNGAIAAADRVPALEIKALTQKYGAVTALNAVDLTVMPGTVVALIGPNGAGKSTLIDCVSGFARPSAGQILIAGTDLGHLPPHKRAKAGVRRTFQQGRTIPDLTIEQYVRLGLSHAHDRALGRQQLAELLSSFSCPQSTTLIKDVDVGTRRLIELAAAVAARPAIVLLDEPSAGLAGAESLALARQIAAIPHLYGPAVLLVEHDMELVTAAASQVVVIDFGNVIASGPPSRVMSDSNVVRAYLGEEVMV